MGWLWMAGFVGCSSPIETMRPELAHPVPTASVVEVPAAAGEEVVSSAREDAMKLGAREHVEIERACRLAVARDESCDDAHVAVDCAFFARKERSGVENAYLCLAKLPCGEDPEPCWSLLPPNTVGSELCKDMARCTPSLACDDTSVSNINANLAWLNDETIDILRQCIAKSECSESERCISNFVALYVPSVAADS
jgi:hypothetical protein